MAENIGLVNAYESLQEIAARLEAVRRPGWGDGASRLDIEANEAGVSVHWLLNEDAKFVPEDEPYIFNEIYCLLGSDEVAPWLKSLTLEGWKIAANGTIDWRIDPIAFANVEFERLKVFCLKSFGDEEGNPHYAGTLALEGGGRDRSAATRLLGRMPVLEELAIPEPPRDPAFFEGPSHPLRSLSVFDVDYESFVSQLAESRRFPHLEELTLRESDRSDVNPRLPLSDYEGLMESEGIPRLRSLSIAAADILELESAFLRNTRVGRQLCCFEVAPVESWCDRPILHAPDSGLLPGDVEAAPSDVSLWLNERISELLLAFHSTHDATIPAVLADALEEAGCDDARLLSHLRIDGPHRDGCWAITVLGDASE